MEIEDIQAIKGFYNVIIRRWGDVTLFRVTGSYG